MRKRRNEEEQKKLCESWKRSGLTQKEFCAENDIHIKSLWRWLKQKKEKQASVQEAIKFLPMGNIPLEKNYLEIILPNGIICKAHLSKENIVDFLGRLFACK
jgi:hypothetical protein